MTGRWRDNRHTLVTELAESGAGDQTIMDIAWHISKRMLKHDSHIRMEAKRTALESIVKKPADADASVKQSEQSKGSQQKSLHRVQNRASQPTSNHIPTRSANSVTSKKRNSITQNCQ